MLYACLEFGSQWGNVLWHCQCVCVFSWYLQITLCLMKINCVILADSALQEQQAFQSISAQISAIYNSTDTRETKRKRERDALVAIWGVTRVKLCSIWEHRVKVCACVSLKTGQQLRWLKQNVLEDGSFRRSVCLHLCVYVCVWRETQLDSGCWVLQPQCQEPVRYKRQVYLTQNTHTHSRNHNWPYLWS